MQFLHKPSWTVFNIGNLNQATLCPNCVQHRVNDKSPSCVQHRVNDKSPNCVQHRVNDKSPNCVQHRVNDKNLLQTMITKNIAV